uniref:Uncharacterized protein n=1 Tax=Panagrolaimus sp. PS1159 TaxID=55785 RepID=A0AC35GKX0_9BILA
MDINNVEMNNLDDLDQADLQDLEGLRQTAQIAILRLKSLGEASKSESEIEIEENIQNVEREMKNACSKIIKMSKIRTQSQKDVNEKQIILLNAQIEREAILKRKADAEAETAKLNLEKARLELENLKKGL